jgi:hypothetical protein
MESIARILVQGGSGVTRLLANGDGNLVGVGVARRVKPGRVERNLHEARAINAKARFAAPEIGRMQQPLGHGDEVCLALLVREQMTREDESGIADLGEPAFCRTNAKSSAQR